MSLLRDRTRSIGARPGRAAAIAWLLAGALVAAISPLSPVRLGEAQPVRAALSVAVTGDARDARPGDGLCATEAGLCTLRAAIQEANAVPGPDSIELAAGTYELAVPPVNENGIETGDLDITDALTIAGAGAADSVIDAGQPQPGSAPEVRGLDRLFEVHASAGEVELSGLTIRDGYAAEHGGAILNAGPASVVVSDSAIEGSVAGKSGGGIDNQANGSVRVVNSRLTGNLATAGSALNNNAGGSLTVAASLVSANGDVAGLQGGSAIENHGELDTAGTVTVTDSTISDNLAPEASGGGIDNNGSGNVTVARTSITKNTSGGNGGAINNESGTVTVSDSTVSENSADNGGGIYNAGTITLDKTFGALTVDRTTISKNTARAEGGGVANSSEGEFSFTRSTISDNTAEAQGGGVSNDDKASLSLSATTVSGNRADSGGGFNNGGDGPVTVVDSEFVRNTAVIGGGGAIRSDSDGELTLARNILSDNEAQEGGGFANDGDGTVMFGGTRVSGNRAQQDGGGIIVSSGTVEIHDSELVDNSAARAGGGMSYHGDGILSVGEAATLTRSQVSHNTTQGSGGGIESRGDGTFSITRSLVSSNSGLTGGGVSHDGDAALTIDRSAVTANSADSGAGLFTDGDGAVSVDNTTVSQNTAGSFGGGLLVSARATLTHVTLADNAAAQGGAISNGGGDLVGDGLVFLRNAIVANSRSGGNCAGVVTSEGGNLDSEDSCGLQPPLDIVNTDPRLGSLRNNGRETLTHALLPESPALDSAVLAHCPATDQRGVPRPQGPGCDIGAFEHNASAVCPTLSTETLVADADAWVNQSSPATNFGSDPTLKVRSQDRGNYRALLQFRLPALPDGCRIESARLRLSAASSTEGRTLEALPITAPWNEAEVSWQNQPDAEGPAATAIAAPERVEWLVTTQVDAMYSHCNRGFGLLIRDAVEDDTAQAEQSFRSRENALEEQPQLVLNLASTGAGDTTPPDTCIAGGPARFSNDPTPTFTFTATEESDFECSLDGRPFTVCNSPHTAPTLIDGEHTFEIRAIDVAGNRDPTPAKLSFSIDTTEPDTTITAGPAGTIPNAWATFAFVANEAASFECRIDDGPFATCYSPHTTAALTPGAHTFQVRAVDRAGNRDRTPASRSLLVEAPGTSPLPAPFPGPYPGAGALTPSGPWPFPGASPPAIAPAPLGLPGVSPVGATEGQRNRSARHVRIRRRLLSVRRGVVTIPLSCPTSESVCAGRIVIRMPSAGQARGWVALASARFRIDGGRTARVRLRLSSKHWALLRRRRALRVQAVIRTRGFAGKATVALRLRAARG